MADANIKPPFWLKPLNKVFMFMLRMGLPISGDEAPLPRQFPTLVPTGISFMKRSGLVTEGPPDEFEALAGRCAVFRIDPV
jgi:hypothetical protein